MMKQFPFALAPALALVAAAAPAFAADAPAAMSVSTSDINLATIEGQRTLDQRIEKAVRGVCRVTDLKTGTRVMSRETKACLAKARAEARAQVAALGRNPIGDRQRGG